jgi:hypothetical protein
MTTTGQIKQISNDHVWENYYQNLIRTVAGSLDPAKQVVTLADNASITDLGNSDPAIAANYVFETANMLPGWNPESAPPDGLLCSYAAFLDNIDLGEVADPDLRYRLGSARINYNIANKNFAAVRSQAVAAWIRCRQIDPAITFSVFVKGNFPLYTLAWQFLQGADSEFEALMFEAYGIGYSDIADARNKCGIKAGAAAMDRPTPYNMAVKRFIDPLDAAGNLLSEAPLPPPCDPVPTFTPTFRIEGFASAYAEWRSNSALGIVAETLNVNGAPYASQGPDYPWPPAGGKPFGDFFGLTDGALSNDLCPINARSPQFSITVNFAGLNTFSVTPGQWFDGTLVDTYKNRLLPTAPRLFGEGGSMALLPTAVIVGFGPSIVMKLESADYSRFKSRCESRSGAALKIGPFCFGNGGGAGIGYDDEQSTITIRPSQKPLPLLLGIVSTKL